MIPAKGEGRKEGQRERERDKEVQRENMKFNFLPKRIKVDTLTNKREKIR